METRVRRLRGEQLCLPCFDVALTGAAPAKSPRPDAPTGSTACACSSQPARPH
ncbi:MAG: hypothetical protein ACR2K2_13235 [Mycobacteriales bacterium]